MSQPISTNPPVLVRRASMADAPTISAFNRLMALETEARKLDESVVTNGVAAVLKDASKGFYLVAEINRQLVGQLMVTYEWSDWRNGVFWWIQSVFVKPEFRGRGIFRALHAYVACEARNQPGVAGLRLYVHTDNAKARSTYERLGMCSAHYEVLEQDFVLEQALTK